MVDYPIGDLIAERVQAMGVKPFYKMFKHDGAWGPNMAAVYSDRGFGVRPPVVFYNRSNEAATLLKPGDFDWAGIFGKGVRWFHSGGLFTALGEGTDEVIIEAMQAAKKAGAVVSFDLNYREKLWNARGGNEKALDVFKKIIQYVDVLVGNEEDLQRALGVPGPAVAAKSGLDPQAFIGMIDQVTKAFPNIKVVATTLREVHSTNRHTWGAVAWIEGKAYVTPICELDVYDRVGGGRRLRVRPVLRAAHRRVAGGVREARMGARRAGDDVPGRHHDGPPRRTSAPSPRAARRASSADDSGVVAPVRTGYRFGCLLASKRPCSETSREPSRVHRPVNVPVRLMASDESRASTVTGQPKRGPGSKRSVGTVPLRVPPGPAAASNVRASRPCSCRSRTNWPVTRSPD